MDIQEIIELHDQKAAARVALLATLPSAVQAALHRLPDVGRHQVLIHIQDLKDPSKTLQRDLKAGMFLGAISYAFTVRQLDSASYQCLFEFEQALTAAPA